MLFGFWVGVYCWPTIGSLSEVVEWDKFWACDPSVGKPRPIRFYWPIIGLGKDYICYPYPYP